MAVSAQRLFYDTSSCNMQCKGKDNATLILSICHEAQHSF